MFQCSTPSAAIHLVYQMSGLAGTLIPQLIPILYLKALSAARIFIFWTSSAVCHDLGEERPCLEISLIWEGAISPLHFCLISSKLTVTNSINSRDVIKLRFRGGAPLIYKCHICIEFRKSSSMMHTLCDINWLIWFHHKSRLFQINVILCKIPMQRNDLWW